MYARSIQTSDVDFSLLGQSLIFRWKEGGKDNEKQILTKNVGSFLEKRLLNNVSKFEIEIVKPPRAIIKDSAGNKTDTSFENSYKIFYRLKLSNKEPQVICTHPGGFNIEVQEIMLGEFASEDIQKIYEAIYLLNYPSEVIQVRWV